MTSDQPRDADGQTGRVAGHLLTGDPPLSVAQVRAFPDGVVDAVVGIDLWDLISGDIERLNDTVSAPITGSEIDLHDLEFHPVGAEGDCVLIRVAAAWEPMGGDDDAADAETARAP
jgi:hypothetical protein